MHDCARCLSVQVRDHATYEDEHRARARAMPETAGHPSGSSRSLIKDRRAAEKRERARVRTAFVSRLGRIAGDR